MIHSNLEWLDMMANTDPKLKEALMTQPQIQPEGIGQFRLYTCDDGSYVFVTTKGDIGMEYNGHIYTRSIRGWMEKVWGEDLGPVNPLQTVTYACGITTSASADSAPLPRHCPEHEDCDAR